MKNIKFTFLLLLSIPIMVQSQYTGGNGSGDVSLAHFFTSGINDFIDVRLSMIVYPNPNEGVFTLMFTSTKQENYDIRVYNNLGVQIFEMRNMYVMGTTRQNIDLRPAPNGVYSVVITNDLRSVVKKIVINK